MIGRGDLDSIKKAQAGAGISAPWKTWRGPGNPLPATALPPAVAAALLLLLLITMFPLPTGERARVRGDNARGASVVSRARFTSTSAWMSRTLAALAEILSTRHHPARSLAFRLLSLASIAIILWPSAGLAYVFREDVDDDWPAITAEFFLHVHTDHLGSSNLYTEGLARTTHGGLRYKKGQLVQRVEYMPFGKERYVLNPGLSEVPKYTGQTYDIDTDLYYYNARYYDPTLARFISADSIIPDVYNPQSLNPYSYVLNNPLKYIDPTGHGEDSYHRDEDNPTISTDNDAFAGAETDAEVTGTAKGETADSDTSGGDSGETTRRDIESFSIIDRERAMELAFEFGTMSGGLSFAGASAIGKVGGSLIEKIGRFFEKLFGKEVINEVPEKLARAIPGEVTPSTIGRSGATDAFVTAAEDIAGLNAREIAERLSIRESEVYTVIEFKTPETGLASPINRPDLGFVGGGRTAGGAREFVVPNGPLPPDAKVRLVK